MRRRLIKFGQSLNMGMDKYTPDSFLFAVLLTFVIFIMGVFLAKQGPLDMIKYWYTGFWGFLGFSMQMVLMIVTGYTLATAPLIKRAINWLVSIPKTSIGASLQIFFITAVLSFVHWGLGIVVGAILAPRLGRSVRKIDFKMVVASSYLGWIVGAIGISISIALLVNSPGHFLEKKIGIIPMTQTSLHPEILISTLLGTFIVAPLLIKLFHPEEKDLTELDENTLKRFDKQIEVDDANLQESEEKTFASIIENSRIITILLSMMGVAFIVYWFITKGFNIELNFFNFLMLFLSIALHGTPRKFYTSFEAGLKLTWGIVLQYPFYAGIQGMIASSGLVTIIIAWFIAISTPATFPFWTYISSSIVNFFIPSSGGILMIQGPIMLDAGKSLGLSYAESLRPFMAGEQISNLIQPFFAIPLLAMAGLKMKDIMGYCIIFYVVLSVMYNIVFILI